MKFVSKELAIKLKEKGFDKPCFGYYYIETPTGLIDGKLVLSRYYGRGGTFIDTLKRYDLPYTTSNIVEAPTLDQVLVWLREEKKIHLVIDIKKGQKVCENIIWGYFVVLLDKYFHCVRHYDFESDSYYDACIAGIEYVVEHLI